MSKTTLRMAVPADVVKIRQLLGMLVDEVRGEGGTDYPEIEDAKLMPFILDVIVNQWCAVIEVDRDGRQFIIGSVALRESSFFWAARPVILDSWFYIHENFRKTRAAVQMMKAVQAYADEREAPLVLGINSGLDLERKEHWYSRQGFDLRGMFFTRGL